MGCGSVTATGEFLVANAANPVAPAVGRIMPIATAFGISIVVLAFTIGPISGGHINPAVTLAILIQRRISPMRAMLYWIAQFSGASAGALMLWGGISNVSYAPVNGIEKLANFTLGTSIVPAVQRPPFLLGANQLNMALNPGNGLILEIMGTSMLVWTVLSTAVDSRSLNQVQMLAPLPIGFSVWVVHLVLIPWTGCGINPARTFGPALINSLAGMDTWGANWWIYVRALRVVLHVLGTDSQVRSTSVPRRARRRRVLWCGFCGAAPTRPPIPWQWRTKSSRLVTALPSFFVVVAAARPVLRSSGARWLLITQSAKTRARPPSASTRIGVETWPRRFRPH